MLKWIKEYSPIEHASKDDPPIGLYYGGVKGAKLGESQPDPTHSPMLGMMLAEKLKNAWGGRRAVLHRAPGFAVSQRPGVSDRAASEMS